MDDKPHEQTCSPPPGSTDRPLNRSTVRTVVYDQFPDLDGAGATLLGEGWDFDAYRVGETVLRFPRRAEIAPRLVDEIRLLEYLRSSVEFNARIPVYHRFGAASDRFPYPFAGYRFIDGASATNSDLSRQSLETLAVQTGEWLASLHDVEPWRARDVGVTNDRQGTEQRLERLLGQADLARTALPPDVADAWEPCLSGDIALPDPHAGTPVLLHNDLVAEHLLVEPKTGKLLGVIDFTDAALGDPVQDFVGLLVAFGKQFVHRALEAYDREIDAGFWERLKVRGDLLRLTQFAEAVRRGADAGAYLERLLDASESSSCELSPTSRRGEPPNS